MRRTSTVGKAYTLLICLDAITRVLLDFFTLIETICSEMWANPLPKNAKSTLPIDVRRSKTSLLKFPIFLS